MDEDFKKSMQGVVPLAADNRVLHVKKTRPIVSRRVEHAESPSPVASADVLRFVREGRQSPLISRFKRHHIAPEDSIDLHGMTSQEAQAYLQQFLQESLAAGYRCVRVIHGKGRGQMSVPVLKNKVNAWLRDSSSVLAFCSAPTNDGGVGAVYVLLN